MFKRKLFFSYGQSNSCWVTIGFLDNMSVEISNEKQDKSDGILILEVKISDNDFLLIILYNANKESEQLHTLSTLRDLIYSH